MRQEPTNRRSFIRRPFGRLLQRTSCGVAAVAPASESNAATAAPLCCFRVEAVRSSGTKSLGGRGCVQDALSGNTCFEARSSALRSGGRGALCTVAQRESVRFVPARAGRAPMHHARGASSQRALKRAPCSSPVRTRQHSRARVLRRASRDRRRRTCGTVKPCEVQMRQVAAT